MTRRYMVNVTIFQNDPQTHAPIGEPGKERMKIQADPHGARFFRGLFFGLLFSIPIWVLILYLIF